MGLRSPPTQNTSDKDRSFKPATDAKASFAKRGMSDHSAATFARNPDLSLTPASGLASSEVWLGLRRTIRPGISLAQLLEGDIRDPDSAVGYSSHVSAGRVQSLLIGLFTALYYLLLVIHDPREFPSLPNGLVNAFAASQALYLGGKAQAMLLGRARNFLK